MTGSGFPFYVIVRKFYTFLYKIALQFFAIGFIKVTFNKEKEITKFSNGSVHFKQIVADGTLVSKIQEALKKNKYLPIGYLDEQGKLVSNLDLKINKKILKETKKPRVKFLIELVICNNGIVGIKKNHKNFVVFYRELYAMLSLQKTSINTPLILQYNIRKKFFIMEYINGKNLRELIEETDAPKKKLKLSRTQEYRTGNLAKQVELITEIERPYVLNALGSKLIHKISSDFQNMLNHRLIYQDVRYPNILIYNEEVYWVDFEHCSHHPILSRNLLMHYSMQYQKKFRKFFNTSLEGLTA